MDTAVQWPQQQQGIGVVKVVSPMEANNNNNNSSGISTAINNNNNINKSSNIITSSSSTAVAAGPPRPQKPQAINCPRCNSTHTKFCYYNNYSLTQPRYFCKTCRRYWTEGGSLRNVPVGGGSRKNKRSSSSSSSSSIISNHSIKLVPDHHQMLMTTSGAISSLQLQNPNTNGKIIFHDHNNQGQDLNLGYPPPPPTTTSTHYYNTSTSTGVGLLSPDHYFVEFPNTGDDHHQNQFFKYYGINGGTGRGSFTSFMSMIPDSTSLSSSATVGHVAGVSFQEFSKPVTTTTSSAGFGGHVNYNGSTLQLGKMSSNHNHAKLFNFPFEDLKQQQTGDDETVKVVNSSTTNNCTTKAGADHEDHELVDHQQITSTRGTASSGTVDRGEHHHHQQHQAAAATAGGYWNNINIGGGTW